MKTEYLEKPEWTTQLKRFERDGYKINQPRHGDSVFTIQGQGYHTRFVNLENCQIFKLPNGVEDLFLPGEAARHTLECFYPHGFEANGGYRKHRLNAPMWLSRYLEYEEAHYFDFVSAYWIIARRLWLDTLFPHSLKLKNNLPLNEAMDWLYFWKAARNGLVGMTYSNKQLRWWFDGVKRRIKPIYTDNKFFNPSLWCMVNKILHEVAHIAIRLGAVFVATDGYIIPGNNGFRFAQILDDVGLRGHYRHYHGYASIKCWGGYSVKGLNIHTGKEIEKTTKKFEAFIQRQSANPKIEESPVTVRLPLYKKSYIYQVDQYHKIINYDFLKWFTKLNVPSMSYDILADRKEKLNNE